MFKEYIGKKFGKLTITALDSLKKNGTPVFAVDCECGSTYLKCGLDKLVSGKTTDCGCSKRNIEMIGKRFGRLVVVEKTEQRKRRSVVWKCLCDCGNFFFAETRKLNEGKIKSCGCIIKERQHFAIGTPIYWCWNEMNNRCHSKRKDLFRIYGSRGISVCDEWNRKNPKGFSNFYDWAIVNGWSEEKLPNGRRKYTLDRIDNDKGYSPDNCRFVTDEIQTENKRNRQGMIYNGEYMLLTKIADINNIPRSVFSRRIRDGWTLEEAINMPIKKYVRKKHHIDGFLTRVESFDIYNISERQLRTLREQNKIRYKIQGNTYYYFKEYIIKLAEYCKDKKNKYLNKYKDFNINATVV